MRTHHVISALTLTLAITAGCGSDGSSQPASTPTTRTTTPAATATTTAAALLDSYATAACNDTTNAQLTSPPPGDTTRASGDYQLLTLRADVSAINSKTPGFSRSWAAIDDAANVPDQADLARRLRICTEYGYRAP